MTREMILPVVYGLIVLVSWGGVETIRRLAPQLRLVDVPNERSSHYRPTPLGGGIPLVLLTMLAWLLAGVFHPVLLISTSHAVVFLVASGLIAGISLLDDLRPISYRLRLGIQLLSALLFVGGYASWSIITLPLLGTVSLGMVGLLLSLLWIVGLTNAFNFMDGIDGMCGGLTLSAGLGWAILGLLTHHLGVALLGGILAAGSLGFLLHNWHPASIFMGDAGATFLGFTFAVLPIIAARRDPALALAGVLLVWPAIFDSGFTVVRRLMKGENIFAPHRTFLFHRLVAAGWSHSRAASLYFGLPVLGAVLAITWAKGNPLLHATVGLGLIALCAALWLIVRHQEALVERQARALVGTVSVPESA